MSDFTDRLEKQLVEAAAQLHDEASAAAELLRRLTDRYPSPINRFTEAVDGRALALLVDQGLATFDGALVHATAAAAEARRLLEGAE